MACHSTLATHQLHKIQPTEVVYQVQHRKITGLDWNSSAPTTVLALHGWLDNAASFSPIAPLMKNINLCAIDMAGQGKSDSRSADGSYDLISELRDLYDLCKVYYDCPVNLVGHSRGAIACALFAAVAPEKVNRLVLIDSIETLPRKLKELPQQLAESLRSQSFLESRGGTQYTSREQAFLARTNRHTPVSRASAELFAERALEQHDKGWIWRADQRLKATSAYRITDEMRDDFYSLITAPTLVIEPSQGLLKLDPRFKNSGKAIADLTRVEVPGGHHCHMDDCPEKVAELIENWFVS